MNALTVQFPESLHRSIKALAEQEGYSVEQFLASAAAEKMAALMTLDYLRRGAAQGRHGGFEPFLSAGAHGGLLRGRPSTPPSNGPSGWYFLSPPVPAP